MTKFQGVVFIIFLVGIIVGVAVLATYKTKDNTIETGQVIIWGTIPSNTITSYLELLKRQVDYEGTIEYREIPEANFIQTFITSLAKGESPDAVILPTDIILNQEDKFISIPYENISRRDYLDRYISGAEIFMRDEGVVAIPFSVDPIVMYWNKELLTTSGIATYPKTWTEVMNFSPKITKKDASQNIKKSAIAFGETRNVNNFKEILSALFFQSGDSITFAGQNGVEVVLGNSMNNNSGKSGASSILEYFASYSNPSNANYSWNRSLPSSKQFFTSGNLGFYFGFASEYSDIRAKNPNLNFDIAPIPQINSSNRATYGKLYGIAFPKAGSNIDGAFSTAGFFSQQSFSKIWTDLTYLPPVRRDLISLGSEDPYLSIFYDSALISKNWHDYEPKSSTAIFSRMVDLYISGTEASDESVNGARNELYEIVKTYNISRGKANSLSASALSAVGDKAVMGNEGIFTCVGAPGSDEKLVEIGGKKFAENLRTGKRIPICNFDEAINQVNFLIKWAFRILVPIITIIVVYAGTLFMSSKPADRTKGRKMLINIAIGFIFMSSAFIIVKLILTGLTGGSEFLMLFN